MRNAPSGTIQLKNGRWLWPANGEGKLAGSTDQRNLTFLREIRRRGFRGILMLPNS
jgi:hypothetical protein